MALTQPCLLCLKWQEYFIRHKGGCILDSESEKNRVLQGLVAAIERRVSHVCISAMLLLSSS